MDHVEYAMYERDVKEFMVSNGLTNLTHENGDKDMNCHVCKEHVGYNEGNFSWHACECCKHREGGNRYHATGWSATDKKAYCFEVCMDCVYYAEYSKLDDKTMLEIEESKPTHYSLR